MHTQRDIFTYTPPVTQCYIVIIAQVNSKTKALALVLRGLQQPTLPLSCYLNYVGTPRVIVLAHSQLLSSI